MKIRVLGCSGATFPGHNPPGFLLDDCILFDGGSLTNVLDARAQLKIENIFITHAHLDHIIGILFLLDNIIVGNIWHRVNIYGIPSVVKTIKRNLLNSSIWPDFTVIPDMESGIVAFAQLKARQSVRINAYTITPYKVNHSVPAVGYLVENGEKKRFFYSGDTGPTDATWRQIGNKKMDCLIIEVSFPNRMERVALATGHLTPRLLKNELLKISPVPGEIYVTHLKTQYQRTIQTELQELGLRNLNLLKDGQTLTI